MALVRGTASFDWLFLCQLWHHWSLKKMRSQPELAVLAKGARRDAKQVFANIAPSIFALLFAFWTKERYSFGDLWRESLAVRLTLGAQKSAC